jgi:hypothetical protein
VVRRFEFPPKGISITEETIPAVENLRHIV